MFRFIQPFPDGTVWNVTPGEDLAEVNDLFRRYWWNPCTAGAIVVVEVRRHVLADYGGLPFIDEILEVVFDKLFHLL